MPAAQHRKFDDGINHDVASFLLPEGYLYDAKNMLFDKLGVARKRGGITGAGATTTYNGDNIGALVADDGTVQFYSRGAGGNVLNRINTATGAFTPLLGSNFGDLILNGGGRPFQHHGTLIWPLYSSSHAAAAVTPHAVAGATGAVASHFFTAPGTVAITAGDSQIVCAAADSPTTLMQVGQIFVASTAGVSQYIGKVTRLVSTTAFEVFPTPSVTHAAGTLTTADSFMEYAASILSLVLPGEQIGGKVGMSFQGRACLASVSRKDPGTGRLELYPRRFQFSSTLLEGDTLVPGYTDGMTWLSANGYPKANFFDIPVHEEITAITPTGFGDALIFSAFRTFRLTGNLSTQYGTDQSITWSVREIPNSVGCISERSLQRTPRGVIFAHDSGIYSTDGASIQPLMYRRLQNDWKSLVRGPSFAIYGSALLRGNHYYICGTSNGTPWAYVVNLDTLAWGPIKGKAAAPASFLINSSVQDPTSASRTWALKWWDESGGAPSMTGGQLVKLDELFEPTSASRADSDTTTVSFEAITRPYTEDSPMTQKQFMGATVEYENIGGASVSVTPQFVLDAAEIAAGGNASMLPRQDLYTVTAGTNAAPIVLTIGAGHSIPQGAFVRVLGVTGLTKANGLWRVGAVTGTTLTLLGSVGNAAYVSGGTVQVVDSRDISLLNAVTTPGNNPAAVVYRINDTDLGGAAGADSFELYGITHTWEDRDIHAE